MMDKKHGWNVSPKPLFIGFVLSLLLSFAAFRLVTHYHLAGLALTLSLLGLATLQAIFQLIFFLHLGLSSKPHWHGITFLFMVLVAFIIIGGTLWIMSNLNYNLMPGMGH